MSDTFLTEPIVLDETGQLILDKLDEIISALSPNAQGVSFDKTGCQIITTNNVQDAVKQLDTGLGNTNSNLAQKTAIKEMTVTGTTNSFGAIGLGLYWATNEIISVTPSDNTTYVLPFTIGLSYYVRVLQDGSSWTVKGNTAVTLTVRYREYTVTP